METFFTVSQQTWLFLWSCVLGAFLGIAFDILRVIRIIKKHSSIAVFIEDMLFIIFSSICIFIYTMEQARGEIKFFIFFGAFLGFILYIVTVGNFVVKIIKSIVLFIKSILNKMYIKIFKPIFLFFKHITQKIFNKFVSNCLKLKKSNKKNKKALETIS